MRVFDQRCLSLSSIKSDLLNINLTVMIVSPLYQCQGKTSGFLLLGISVLNNDDDISCVVLVPPPYKGRVSPVVQSRCDSLDKSDIIT